MIAYFAGGCFWGVEEAFSRLAGVSESISGYMGGEGATTYEEVSSSTTLYAESVKVVYDENIISYEQLCETFFAIHDATTLNRQGPDIGPQYRSEIFYVGGLQYEVAKKLIASDAKIVTRLTDSKGLEFYEAEAYHQRFYKNHPDKLKYSCHIMPMQYLKD